MKRVVITLGILASVAGCGSSSTPTQPSNLVVFTVNLLPSNETPPITNAEQTARGTAVVTVHKDTNVIEMNVSVTGFPAGSVLNDPVLELHGASGSLIVSNNQSVPSPIDLSGILTPFTLGLVHGPVELAELAANQREGFAHGGAIGFLREVGWRFVFEWRYGNAHPLRRVGLG